MGTYASLHVALGHPSSTWQVAPGACCNCRRAACEVGGRWVGVAVGDSMGAWARRAGDGALRLPITMLHLEWMRPTLSLILRACT